MKLDRIAHHYKSITLSSSNPQLDQFLSQIMTGSRNQNLEVDTYSNESLSKSQELKLDAEAFFLFRGQIEA